MIFTPCMHDYSIKVHCLSLLRYKYNGTCSYIKANLTWAYHTVPAYLGAICLIRPPEGELHFRAGPRTQLGRVDHLRLVVSKSNQSL